MFISALRKTFVNIIAQLLSFLFKYYYDLSIIKKKKKIIKKKKKKIIQSVINKATAY